MENTNATATTATEAIRKSMEVSSNLFELIKDEAPNQMKDEATATSFATAIMKVNNALLEAAQLIVDRYQAKPRAAR